MPPYQSSCRDNFGRKRRVTRVSRLLCDEDWNWDGSDGTPDVRDQQDFVTWYVTGTTRGGHRGEAVQTNDDHDNFAHQCPPPTATAKALRVRGRPSQPLRNKARLPSSIFISGSSPILISLSYKRGSRATLLWLLSSSLLTSTLCM